MKRFLGIILAVCMLLCILPANVFAATDIKELHATVTPPEIGKKPSKVKLPDDSRFTITEQSWSGNFDNGTFKEGESYTVTYKVKFKNYKDVVNYRLNIKEGRKVTLNGYEVTVVSNDKIENATLKYTFPPLTSTPTEVQAPKETKTLTKEYTVTEEVSFTEEPETFSGRIFFDIVAPVTGQTPVLNVSTTNPEIEIAKVTLNGTFNADGTYIEGDPYKFVITFVIKGDVNMILPPAARDRDATVSGKETSYNISSKNPKQGTLSISFDAPHSKTYLDVSRIYSAEHADSLNWQAKAQLFVIKNSDQAWRLNLGTATNSDGTELNIPVDSITHIIVDTADNVDNTFMEEMLNLKEVWLSPDVNVTKFIGDHAGHGPAYQWLYAWQTNAAKTWDFKLYVPESKLPEVVELFNSMNGRTHRMRWFETVVYSGNDVYDAYEKKLSGQDVSIPWCTNHEYTFEITTADRVMIEQDCGHTRSFCYSCRICGKSAMRTERC